MYYIYIIYTYIYIYTYQWSSCFNTAGKFQSSYLYSFSNQDHREFAGVMSPRGQHG